MSEPIDDAVTAADLGWDGRWDAYLQVATMNSPGDDLAPGRVVAVHRGTVIVQPVPASSADTGALAEPVQVGLATPGNADEDAAWPPVVGDWVGLSHHGDATVIAAILPRRTYLERPSASRSSVGQPVAANVDVLLIVEPMQPAPSVGRVERFTALARSAGAQAWLVVTKADLATAQERQDALEELGHHTDRALATAADDPVSVEALRSMLPAGATAVLVGRSGAGKSTLTNALLGTDLVTGAVREGDAKGRHTTTSRQLVTAAGISLIDTPGIRALAATTDADAIDDAFADVATIAASCRYTDCSHTGEPGCAVAAAIDEGVLDEERVERYLRMLRESARLATRQDARVSREHERRATKDSSRGRRGTMRLKGRGPTD